VKPISGPAVFDEKRGATVIEPGISVAYNESQHISVRRANSVAFDVRGGE
jgi:hypothetical protein